MWGSYFNLISKTTDNCLALNAVSKMKKTTTENRKPLTRITFT